MYCLSYIMNVNLNDDILDKPLQERGAAQCLVEIIVSLYNRKSFEYAEETTLNACYNRYGSEGHE